MASTAKKVDTQDWKSLLIFTGCVVGGQVLSGLLEVIAQLNLTSEYRLIFSAVVSILLKFLQRYYTDFQEKSRIEYRSQALSQQNEQPTVSRDEE